MGLYAVGMMVDGRGPSKALVDTGAAGSFMNWDGARQIGIAGPQDASLVQLSSFGAMGVDNQAISLTHRKPSAKIEFQTKDVKDQSARSVPAAADVDIGDLPVLAPGSPFHADGVTAIVGTDLLFRSASRLVIDFPRRYMYRL
eukprot:FR734683.1.p1 GENE.FR734683.1~~FR734683.1.p1  ORF type:complete len:168 (+),score=13.63 FR734683.1:77-505(+)